jgi:glycosyltransferase involved in cell wall biosynthesis
MDRANYALASYMARAGHQVTLVAHRVAPELLALPGVIVRLVRKPLGSNFLGQWPLAHAGQAMVRAGNIVVSNGSSCPTADVNWVHYLHAAYRPRVAASLFRRLKGWIEYPLNIRAERTALRAARLVVCNSEFTRRQVVELCGLDADTVITIYYGSDPDQFYPSTPPDRAALRDRLGWDRFRPVVIFIGALGDRRKGFDTLFSAWTRLCNAGKWDSNLVVVGSGPERQAWQKRAAQAGLADRIEFLGFRSDVPDLLRAADALVAPTRYEAYGLGVQEALCCGLPAFVSASAGIAERYPPELADLLIPDPDDAVDLASRLRRWKDASEKWRSLVTPLSESLRAYTWDDMAEAFLRAITMNPNLANETDKV